MIELRESERSPQAFLPASSSDLPKFYAALIGL
jgi:hypothetical protein